MMWQFPVSLESLSLMNFDAEHLSFFDLLVFITGLGSQEKYGFMMIFKKMETVQNAWQIYFKGFFY